MIVNIKMTAAELQSPNFNDASQLIMESKKLKTRATDTFLATATALLRVMGLNSRSRRKNKKLKSSAPSKGHSSGVAATNNNKDNIITCDEKSDQKVSKCVNIFHFKRASSTIKLALFCYFTTCVIKLTSMNS